MEIMMMSWCELGHLPPLGWYEGPIFKAKLNHSTSKQQNNNNNNNSNNNNNNNDNNFKAIVV